MDAYKLTKMDLTAMKQADTLVIAFNGGNAPGHYRETGVSAIRRARKTEANPFAEDVRHDIAAPVTVTADYGADLSGALCFAHVSLFPTLSEPNHARSIINTLRVGDEIEFRFYADYGATITLTRGGLHPDALLLRVRRNDRLAAEFEFDRVCAPENSARMCRNVPETMSMRHHRESAAAWKD